MSDRWPGCSSISFRHLGLAEALRVIGECGFTEIDLGALPGVCDHVPYDLTEAAVAEVVSTVRASGLAVRSVNGDIGDLNRVLDERAAQERETHLGRLLDLTAGCGAEALVLPCGAQSREPVTGLDADLDRVAGELARAAAAARAHGVAIWVEAPHFFRLCGDVELAARLIERLDPAVGVVLDTSHIVASGGDPADFARRFGPRIAHVHLRDAKPGGINHSIGNGVVDFPAAFEVLRSTGYGGACALELETRDVTDDERPAAAVRAAQYIATLL
ncbi:sugar phosphate isomerase/epimerase [Saccharopolyspora sp. NPDC002686]|uniref:sugar phosphate isomerase/epimerase family protein n=1 Tax=Saccharopolyspora sp. NPDC002686 TaxID=3154541 RepID=UPI00332751F0